MRYARAAVAAAALALLCTPAFAGDWTTSPGGSTVATAVVPGEEAWITDFAATSGFLSTDQCSCADSFIDWNADTSGAAGAADVTVQTCNTATANACGAMLTTTLDSTKSGIRGDVCGSRLRVLVNTPPGGGETPRLVFYCR